jgi:hypothetical protein
MSTVRYELGSYLSEDGILRSRRRETTQILLSINPLSSVAEM